MSSISATPTRSHTGEFDLLAPQFTVAEKRQLGHNLQWTVLNGNFKDDWKGRTAKPSEPILKLGAKGGPWEIEMRIPQKHIGQVLKAYERNGGRALDIDFVTRSDPSRTYRGKLYRDKIASEAVPNRDEKDESEPEVIAYVSIDDPDIDPAYRLSQGADQRHRGPRQGSLRQSPARLRPVLRRLGVLLRKGRVLLLKKSHHHR